jgi:hypothetical protein
LPARVSSFFASCSCVFLLPDAGFQPVSWLRRGLNREAARYQEVPGETTGDFPDLPDFAGTGNVLTKMTFIVS